MIAQLSSTTNGPSGMPAERDTANAAIDCRMIEHGTEMRLIVVFGAICALSQPAAAQTAECRSIADPAARLACYDRTAPSAANAPAPRLPEPPKSQAATIDNAKNVDVIGDEDAAVNAKLHGICRGC